MMKKKAAKNKGGQPTKYNQELADSICSDIRGGLGQDESAIRNGISRETMRRWLKSKVAFFGVVEKAKTQFEHDNLLVIRQASINLMSRDGNTLLRKGTWTAAAWLLERRMHDKYGMKWAGELTGKGGKPLVPNKPAVDLSHLSDAQLAAMGTNLGAIIQSAKSTPMSHTNGNGNGSGHP